MTIDDFTPEQIAAAFDRIVQDFYNDFVGATGKTLHKHALENATRMQQAMEAALEWRTWQHAVKEGLVAGIRKNMPVDFCVSITNQQCLDMGIRIGLELANEYDAPIKTH